jgi:hypothetical protein
MKRKKLLLATAALTSAIACGGKKKEPIPVYSNPKGGHYDQGLTDAGVDAPPPADAPDDANPYGSLPIAPVRANTKGSFYDQELVKLRTK